MRISFVAIAVVIVSVVCAPAAWAQYRQVQVPLKTLPEDHEYQRKIRAYLGTLTEKDFAVEIKKLTVVPPADVEQQYKLWVLGVHAPLVDGLVVPASGFTLASIEGAESLRLPATPNLCQSIAWWTKWDYPGNPYRDSRALKLRAFVLAAIDVVMLDYLYEHNPQGADRADYLGGNMIWFGFTYTVVKDALPPDVQKAFEAGLKKHVLRINQWGPKGMMTDMDLFAPVGLWYIQSTMKDPEVSKVAKDYSRQLFTDPHYFNAAGYFVDNGCFDTSYNGISLYFAAWAGLLTDWDFVDEAVDKAFRLRAHLSFPDPDGERFVGPSAMSSRTSGDPPSDQWNFPYRPLGTAMATDESLHLASTPSAETLKAAAESLTNRLNDLLDKPYKAPEMPIPWAESHWSNMINFPFESYVPGYYTRRLKLEQEKSPLLLPLYKRPGTFVRQFDKAFVITKQNSYASAIHTGPVGRPVGHGGRPYGYGGGQLSVFWTPDTGVVIAGRRRGVQGAVYDTYEEWREQPAHAISGLTDKNELVTTNRITQPEPRFSLDKKPARVTVSGRAPKYNAERNATSESTLQYERSFDITDTGLKVTTTVGPAGEDDKEKFTELYETIPVFIAESKDRPSTKIEFLVNGAWTQANPGKTANVSAAKLSRFKGAATITFAKPVTLVVSEKSWIDGFQTTAEVRNLRIDLLGGATTPTALKKQTIEYTIAAAK